MAGISPALKAVSGHRTPGRPAFPARPGNPGFTSKMPLPPALKSGARPPHSREAGAIGQALIENHRLNAAYVVRRACDPRPDGTGGETVVDHIRLFPLRDDVRGTYRVHEQILPALRKASVPVRWTDLTVRHTGYVDRDLRRKPDRDSRLLGILPRATPGRSLRPLQPVGLAQTQPVLQRRPGDLSREDGTDDGHFVERVFPRQSVPICTEVLVSFYQLSAVTTKIVLYEKRDLRNLRATFERNPPLPIFPNESLARPVSVQMRSKVHGIAAATSLGERGNRPSTRSDRRAPDMKAQGPSLRRGTHSLCARK